ncbi:MAG: hypothetical protein HQK96_06685 [Nitrospirae bacterium]|nr:hypothetical protein [Nitrospirota bacterium]
MLISVLISDFSGTLAAILFIIANAYYPAKIITRQLLGNTKEIAQFFQGYLKVHILLNLLGLWITLFHGHYADERNVILQMSFLVTVWLSVVGAMMYFKWPYRYYREMKLVHSQQLMFYVWIVLIIVGHSII